MTANPFYHFPSINLSIPSSKHPAAILAASSDFSLKYVSNTVISALCPLFGQRFRQKFRYFAGWAKVSSCSKASLWVEGI